MRERKLRKTDTDLIYLISCSIHEKKADECRVQSMDLQGLYEAACRHSLSAAACAALEKTEVFRAADAALVQKWKETKEKAVRKSLLLNTERAAILKDFEEKGIWNIPLKGVILQNLYPAYGMREMSDNDILCDGSRREEIKLIMKKHGYFVETYGKIEHDVYMKPPVYTFEMHSNLFNTIQHEVWGEYYQNVKEKLIADTDSSFGYHFTDEDFYIYMITHAKKHYNYSGTGLRTLLDVYVYCQKKGNEMDWEYIETELQKLGVAEFEKQTRKVAEKAFTGEIDILKEDIFTEEEWEILCYYSRSGTYGTANNRVKNQINRLKAGEEITLWDKMHYIRSRIFPDIHWFQAREPFYAKHRLLIPFFLVRRMFCVTFYRWNSIKNEWKALKEIDRKS